MGGSSGAADFSGAMARQAIDEAMNELPTQHRQVVKLAYFGGLTNRQIAQQLGLTEGGVRTRLRDSLATVSAYMEKGRVAGRRAVHGLVIWLSWRRFSDDQRLHGPAADQVLQAGVVAIMTVAAALLVTHPAPQGNLHRPHTAPRVSAAGTAPSQPATVQVKLPVTAVGNPVSKVNVADALPQPVALPALPVKVQVPALLISLPIPTPHLSSPIAPTRGVLP